MDCCQINTICLYFANCRQCGLSSGSTASSSSCSSSYCSSVYEELPLEPELLLTYEKCWHVTLDKFITPIDVLSSSFLFLFFFFFFFFFHPFISFLFLSFHMWVGALTISWFPMKCIFIESVHLQQHARPEYCTSTSSTRINTYKRWGNQSN